MQHWGADGPRDRDPGDHDLDHDPGVYSLPLADPDLQKADSDLDPANLDRDPDHSFSLLVVLSILAVLVPLAVVPWPSWLPPVTATPAHLKLPKNTEMMVRILSAGMCPGVAMAMTRGNTSLRMKGKTSVVFDIDLELSKTATSISQMVVNLTRCREYVSISSCKPSEVYPFKVRMCSLIAAPMMPWSTFVEKIQPSLKCPIKKGSYSGRGIEIDLQAAKSVLRTDDGFGSVVVGQGLMFDQENMPFMCIQVTADAVPVKKRQTAKFPSTGITQQ